MAEDKCAQHLPPSYGKMRRVEYGDGDVPCIRGHDDIRAAVKDAQWNERHQCIYKYLLPSVQDIHTLTKA